ncbi:MAG: RNA polymerase sigma factor [Anaerolineae bacterium]
MEKEEAWIERAKAGDKEAFARLVEAYQVAVYNLTYRMLGNAAEAEDAAQETFLRAYRRLSTFKPEKKFSTWLLSIASHYCIDQLRRRRFTWLSLEEMPPWQELSGARPHPEEEALRQETCEEVHALLEKLPGPYRAVAILRYWYELSYEEIAEIMDTTESAIKSRLYRARRMLASSARDRGERNYGEG